MHSLAQISYAHRDTPRLDLLQANRVDVSARLHWGRWPRAGWCHPALLRQHVQHRNWVLIRAFHANRA